MPAVRSNGRNDNHFGPCSSSWMHGKWDRDKVSVMSMCVCASASVCSSHNLDILTTDKWKIPRGRMAKLRVIFIVDVCVVCCVCLRSLFIRFGLFYYARKTFANILLRHLLLTNDERTNANAFYAWCARDRMLRSYYFFIMLFFSFSFFFVLFL